LTKRECLSSVTVTIDKVSVTITWRHDGDFFFTENQVSLSKAFAGCPKKKIFGDKKTVVDVQFGETYLLSVTLGKVAVSDRAATSLLPILN
jgi:hypothetical protein